MTQRTISLAKTTRPSAASVVSRQRLFTVLDRALQRGIGWVSGPPGSGKTSLLSSFLEERGLDYIWYQLDQGDGDIATFFHYLTQAARKRAAESASRLPVLSVDYGEDVASFARNYFRELYARVERPSVVIFDNYQTVSPQSKLHAALDIALSEAPKGVCVIIASRSDPPGRLARFRANQTMEVIRWNDLRLTREELTEVIEIRAQRLSRESVEQLYDSTRGWAAGVVLMLEHAKMKGAVGELPSSRVPEVVFDYLAGEIFDEFDPAAQEILMRTACLPRLNMVLAERLTGNQEAGPLFLNLARNDYFVAEQVMDDDRIYQLHPLFREFLQRRARECFTPKKLAAIRREAATLLQTLDQPEEAIDILLDGKEWAGALPVLLEQAPEMIAQGRGETLGGWLEELPSRVIEGNPWVLYWFGLSKFFSAPRESRRLFEQANTVFEAAETSDVRGSILCCCGIIDSIAYELDDLAPLDGWTELLERLWESYPKPAPEKLEARVIHSMFMSIVLRAPVHRLREQWMERARSLVRSGKDPGTRTMLEPLLAMSLLWAGRHQEALDSIGELRDSGREGALPPVVLANVKNIESMCLLFSGNLERCEKAVAEGLELAEAHGVRPWADQLFAQGVAAKLHAADLDGADKLLSRWEGDSRYGSRLDRCLQQYLRGWYWLLRDDAVASHAQARSAHRVAKEVGIPFFDVACRLALAQSLAACGDERKSISELRRATENLSEANTPLLEYLAQLTAAQIAQATDDPDGTMQPLDAAFRAGRELEIVHLPWSEPGLMAELCAGALSRSIEVDFARHAIRALRLSPEGLAIDVDSWPWRWRIYTLGKFRLLAEGKPQSTAGRSQGRPVELMKVLIALGGRDVRAEQLAEILWPHVDGDYSYRSFTSALHRLRRLLGLDEAVLLRDGRVSLNPSYVWLDTWTFDRRLTHIDEILDAANDTLDPETLRELSAELRSSYGGAFLQDESEHACYIAYREQMRSKFQRYTGKLIRHWDATGYLEWAVDHFEHGIECDPLCEDFYRQLMRVYQKLDRKADALDVYDRCCKNFSAQLRSSPSAETVAVYEELRKA